MSPTKKVPISMRALLARINRKLSDDGRRLVVARPGSQQERELGRHYVVQGNVVKDTRVDLEPYARRLGVLHDVERLVE